MGRIGLVVEGGGMKCAYSAGILDRFLDEGITFDYCVGVSAGVANAASYLAGQRGRTSAFTQTTSMSRATWGSATF
jgi:predicted patatin/cPLA2 family phospholipase